MTGTTDLTRLLVTIANLDHQAALTLLNATPSLATARLARRDEFFLAERLAQIYQRRRMLRGSVTTSKWHEILIPRGADVLARNRRGAEPLHAAVTGARLAQLGRGTPDATVAVIERLKDVYGLDLRASDSHQLAEAEPDERRSHSR